MAETENTSNNTEKNWQEECYGLGKKGEKNT